MVYTGSLKIRASDRVPDWSTSATDEPLAASSMLMVSAKLTDRVTREPNLSRDLPFPSRL